MERRVFALLAWFLALVVAPVAAHAQETRIEAYQLTVRPEKEGLPAHFELDLTYYAPAENKTSGFKLVGRRSVMGLRARSGADGTPLAVKSAAEPSSGETKIDFDLPKRDARGRQRVIVDFDQGFEIQHGFWGEVAVIPWAHQFRIPVDHMTLVAVGPRAMSGEGLTCKKGAQRCSLGMKQPFEASLAVGDPQIVWLVAWAGTMGLVLIAWVVLLVRRKRQLIELRGVLPPAEPVAYPDPAAGYRGPPPLPEPTQAKAVLSESDTVSLWSRAFVALLAVAAPQALLARCTLGIADLHATMTVLAIVAAVATFQWAMRDGHVVWLLVGLTPLAFGLVTTSLVFAPILILGCIIAAIIAAAVKLASVASTQTRWGTVGTGSAGFFTAGSTCGSSSSTSSSSCSSSSCGGGGGSSCGGGGGGGGCGG